MEHSSPEYKIQESDDSREEAFKFLYLLSDERVERERFFIMFATFPRQCEVQKESMGWWTAGLCHGPGWGCIPRSMLE